MARPSNTSEMVSMSVSLTRQIKAYLDDLALDGTYGGGNPSDVAKFLLNNAINALIKDGTLIKKTFAPAGDNQPKTDS